MSRLLSLFTKPMPVCDNFSGTVKSVEKGQYNMLVGKCITCKNNFADHSSVKSKCPRCGKKQPSQCGSIKNTFGKKYSVIKFNACDCAVNKRFRVVATSHVDPTYVDLKPVVCKCGKILSYEENPSNKQAFCEERSSRTKSFAFCGDINCFMANYYVAPKNVDLSSNTGVKLPPLIFTKLANTKFCSCGNVCEYNLEKNAYEPKCRHCNLRGSNDQKSMQK